jgi:hypothetical protein
MSLPQRFSFSGTTLYLQPAVFRHSYTDVRA